MELVGGTQLNPYNMFFLFLPYDDCLSYCDQEAKLSVPDLLGDLALSEFKAHALDFSLLGPAGLLVDGPCSKFATSITTYFV